MTDLHLDAIVAALEPDADCFYRSLGGGRYRPTLHTQGVWFPHEQHMGPVSALLAHALERFDAREDLLTSRLTFEILGVIPATETTVACRTVRGGRTIHLVEAVLTAGGREAVRATAWRLQPGDSSQVAGGAPEPMVGPDRAVANEGIGAWRGGYLHAVHWRYLPDPGREPGRGRAWVRTDVPLVDTEPSSPVADYLRVLDPVNGLAGRAAPGEWVWPNVDLTVHLYRTPQRGWVGLDYHSVWGSAGIGLTSAQLFDERGGVGRAEQIVTIRRRPGSPRG